MSRYTKLVALEEAANPTDDGQDPIDAPEALRDEESAANEFENLSANTERSIDVSEALESIYLTLEGKTEFTPTEIRLTRIATEMAVAGTGVGCDRLLPSLENIDTKAALEGIADKFHEITNSILNGFSEVAGSLKKWVSKLVSAYESYKAKIEAVREHLHKLKADGKKSVKNFETPYTATLVIDRSGAAVKNFSELSRAYKKASDNIGSIIKSVVDNARVVDNDYGMYALMKDLFSVEATGRKFFDNAMVLSDGIASNKLFKKSGQSGSSIIFESDVMPGGSYIRLAYPNTDRFDKDEYSEIKRVSTIFRAEFMSAKEKDVTKSVGFDKIDLKDLETILESISNIVENSIESFKGLEKILDNAGAKFHRNFNKGLIVLIAAGYMTGTGVAIGGIQAATAATSEAALQAGLGTIYSGAKIIHTTAGTAIGLMLTRALMFSYRMLFINNRYLQEISRSIRKSNTASIEGGLSLLGHVVSSGTWE